MVDIMSYKPFIHSITSTSNSTTTPLSSAATYTGTGEQNDYPQVGVMLKTDNTCTLYFDFSNDGTNWDSTFPSSGFKVASGISEFHTAVKLKRYFRVRLVNDTGAQSYLRLTTYYGHNFTDSNHPLNQSIGLDTDAKVTRPTKFEDEVTIGRRSGVTPWTKFAYRTGLTAANGEETIWNASGNFTPLTSASTFTITYTNTTDGLGQNGALSLNFYYIDSSGNPAISSHTLSNTGSDVTSFSGYGINRIVVLTSGSSAYNVSDITITATTGGTTQAFIAAGECVTQQAIFHVGFSQDAIATYLRLKVNKLSGGSAPRVIVKGYVYSRYTSTRYLVYRETIDTSSDPTIDIVEPVGFKLNNYDVLYFVADTDTNSTNITCRFSLRAYDRT